MAEEKVKLKPENSAKKWGIVIVTLTAIMGITVISMKSC